MREEVSRLESKEYLSDDEHRRYRSLKCELEYRRRLHSVNDDNGVGVNAVVDESTPSSNLGSSSMMKVENEFDELLRSLEPTGPRETAPAISDWQNQ